MRAVIGIDPSRRSTGIAVRYEDGVGIAAVRYEDGVFRFAPPVNLDRARWMDADSIEVINRLLGESVTQWCAAVEKSPPATIHSGRRVATQAGAYWCRVLEEVARQRATQAGKRYRKPMILRPTPSQWRNPLGILGTREACKAQAIRYASDVLNVDVGGCDDVAEALAIAAWASRRAPASRVQIGKTWKEPWWVL